MRLAVGVIRTELCEPFEAAHLVEWALGIGVPVTLATNEGAVVVLDFTYHLEDYPAFLERYRNLGGR